MADHFGHGESDRLPWLETVEDEPERGGGARAVLLVLLGLLVLSAVIFGIYRLQSNGSASGEGELIAAQEGDYKIKPDDPGGLKVEGEGDSAVAASAGAAANGAIDLKAVPEAPVSGARIPERKPTAVGAASTTSSVPPVSGQLKARRPLTAPSAPVPGAASGGALVQLGAFPSQAAANAAWSAIARRFAYIAPLGKSVEAVTINERTFYRLRVNAGSADAAADICGRLKVAGENCFVTS